MIFAVAMTFHRPDDRVHRGARNPEAARPHEHRRAMGDQCLPTLARRPVRLRRPARRHGRAPQDGHARVVVFAGSSAMCGLTPKGSLAEAWIVTFRVIQGAGGAIMFPAALAIVVHTFAPARTGQGVGDLLRYRRRSHGDRPDPRRLPHPVDLAGHLLGEHPGRDHRSVLIVISKPVTVHRPARMDYRGLALIASGVALSVFGFQQSADLGVEQSRHLAGHRRGGGASGRVLLRRAPHAVTAHQGGHLPHPAVPWSENLVARHHHAGLVPVFFFASEYAQIGLGRHPRKPVSCSCTSSSAS